MFSFSSFFGALLPLFVALNIFGTLPIFIGMTSQMEPRARKSLLLRAITVAVSVALMMLFAGELIFETLGITVNDLRVGGGLILLVLSISDLVFGELRRRRSGEADALGEGAQALAVVPLGIPLIMGPAAITTILVTQGQYGYLITLASILVNMSLVYVSFRFGPRLLGYFGPSFSQAVAKVASLFLAAIAVAMIRRGVMGMLALA